MSRKPRVRTDLAAVAREEDIARKAKARKRTSIADVEALVTDDDPPFFRRVLEREAEAERAEHAHEREARAERAERRHRTHLDVGARRRARKAGTQVDPISRATIIARDGHRCYLCGQAVDPDDVHLDHIIPLARGGTHTADNLAVTHSRCNVTKGADLTDKRPPALLPSQGAPGH